jgi:hypothetical protein
MAVDLYPDEEGHISDGLVIGYCKAQTTIVQNQAVFLHSTSVSGVVSVAPGVADADSCAVALKAASAGEWIPVCFYGVVKMYGGSTITAGDVVCNDASAIFVGTVPDYDYHLSPTYLSYYAGVKTGATVYRLGLALQNANAAATGGELLILVGKMV